MHNKYVKNCLKIIKKIEILHGYYKKIGFKHIIRLALINHFSIFWMF